MSPLTHLYSRSALLICKYITKSSSSGIVSRVVIGSVKKWIRFGSDSGKISRVVIGSVQKWVRFGSGSGCSHSV